jgi:hypothetical protein
LRRLNVTADEFEDIIWRDRLKKERWEIVDRIAYRYNRALFFPAGLFHSGTKNFGTTLEDGRLWQSFHFALKRGG